MKHETLHDTNSAGHISETAKNYFKEVLKVEEAVEAGLIYAYLATKFSTFSTKRDTFVKKMNNSKSMFKRNTNGAYFLTEEAENNMKVLIENSKRACPKVL